MNVRQLLAIAALIVPLVPLGAPTAAAQNVMSSEEIQQRLNKQATRGLKLSKPAEPTQPAAQAATQGAAPTKQAVAVERQTKPAVQQVSTAAPRFDPDEEVNLTVGFAFDSAVLLPEAKTQLRELCAALKSVGIDRFNVYGHTDAAGSVEYNLTLSQARANEVKRYLTGECGLPQDRIEAIGMGESRLYDPSQPRGAKNRRVEVQIAS